MAMGMRIPVVGGISQSWRCMILLVHPVHVKQLHPMEATFFLCWVCIFHMSFFRGPAVPATMDWSPSFPFMIRQSVSS